MTRPIELDLSKWCSITQASALTGRDERTIQRWIKSGQVRTHREPGGRGVLLYMPDFLPPETLPARQVS